MNLHMVFLFGILMGLVLGILSPYGCFVNILIIFGMYVLCVFINLKSWDYVGLLFNLIIFSIVCTLVSIISSTFFYGSSSGFFQIILIFIFGAIGGIIYIFTTK